MQNVQGFPRYSEVAQFCPTLCNPMDCSLLGSSIHGSLQARIQEWVAISFSRGSSQPRDQALVSCIAGEFFTPEPPGKPTEGLLSLFYFLVLFMSGEITANVSDPVERETLKIQETIAETMLLSG